MSVPKEYENCNMEMWREEDAMDSMGALGFLVNIVADVFPPGFLALTSGLHDTGFVPAIAMVTCIFFAALYTMYAVGRTIEITGKISFAEQWSLLVGPRTSWIPSLVIILTCLGFNLMLLSFSAELLLQMVPIPRSLLIIVLTAFPIYPLCCLKELSSLTLTSSISMVVILYTCAFMVVRALDGTYHDHHHFYEELEEEGHKPEVEISHHFLKFSVRSSPLLCIVSVAFLTHYNGCKFYRELHKSSPERFKQCTALGLSITLVLYIITTTSAYLTFGLAAEDIVLNNYAHDDHLAVVAKVGMAFSMLFAFPIMFTGLREQSIALLCFIRPAFQEVFVYVWWQDVLTGFLTAFICISCILCEDPSLIIEATGSVCGSICIFVIPGILHANAIDRFMAGEDRWKEAWMNRAIALVGLCAGLVAGIGSQIAHTMGTTEDAVATLFRSFKWSA